MKKEKEYKQHIEECLSFARRIAEATVGQDNEEMTQELMWAVFDKVCTPLHYFLQDIEQGASQPPTEKQIAYAMQLGIQDPEQYTRLELSKKINEAVKERKNGTKRFDRGKDEQ